MKIRIDAPASDARRDEIERRTFEQLDAIRAATDVPASVSRRERIEEQVFARVDAMRTVERADSVTGRLMRPQRRPWLFVGGGLAAAAAVFAIVVGISRTRDPVRTQTASGETATPSRVVTPVGGASRFIVGDAVIDAGSDTSVDVKREASGAVTLVLARGSIDCDVEHRPDRPAFVVVAGDVNVRVVGTRFAVTRRTSATDDLVRVDVTRGKVSVKAPSVERFVGAGETWSNGLVADARNDGSNDDSPQIEFDESKVDVDDDDVDDDVARPSKPRDRSDKKRSEPAKPIADDVTDNVATEAAYKEAQKLEARDRPSAAREFRRIANGEGPWAALALYSLAELEAGRGRAGSKASLAAITEYLKRFPRGNNAEDVAWLRVEVSRTAKDRPGARDAAIDYLKRFPAGTYAKPAKHIADAPLP